MTNYKSIDDHIPLDLGATVSAGTASQVGIINCVPITDAVSGTAVACKIKGVFSMSVTGADNAGNAAISIGDKLYLDSGVLNVDNVAGVAWGYALGAVASGDTSTIDVLIGQF